ncbi:MAG TPA: DUF6537 domain-containing protein, partial [Rhizobacter sp.]|nr:DUF6537 domain-containing protein [Rhizobacter sp.]
IVAAGKATLSLMREGRTYVALNSHATPTAAFVGNPDWQNPTGGCEAALQAAVGRDNLGLFDADQVAVQLLGDSIYTNPLLLGYAWQKGQLPLSRAALLRAMELNGVQVENNKAAFEWGRRAAHDLAAVQALFSTSQVIEFVKRPSLDEIIGKHVSFLTGYQNAAYAAQYKAFVDKVHLTEVRVNGSTQLAEAVARYLFKLMAYKDEYEVARLHTDRGMQDKLAARFEGDYRLHFHLAPPLLGKKNAQGEPVKQRFGPWMLPVLRVLAKLKGLRGTPFDPFGRTPERREERGLIDEYRACIDELLTTLNADSVKLAAEIARIPEGIRGYGPVKARHLAAARLQWQTLMGTWRSR